MSLYDFFTAIRQGNLSAIESHLDSGKFSVKTQNDLGFTGLLFASTYGQTAAVDLLLEKGADILHQDNDGWSCLHKAAYCNHVELFKHLLSKGADPSLSNADGKLGHQMQSMGIPPVGITLTGVTLAAIVGQVDAKPFHVNVPSVDTPPNSSVDTPPNSPTDTLDTPPVDTLDALDTPPNLSNESPTIGTPHANVVTIPTGSIGETMFLFPGQGAQKVGMVHKYLETPQVKELFKEATEVLGYDILEVCENGPEATLNDTLVSQPAIYLTSLAALLTLQHTQPDVLQGVGHAAGFSLGEYTALVFGGSLNWKDGLRLIKTRATAMQKAANAVDSGMVSLVGLDDSAVERICKECDVQVANYLFPKGRVISGGVQELDNAIIEANKAGAQRAIKLKVSGAFHSKFMSSAQEELETALKEVPLMEPTCQVYANVDTKPYTAETIRIGLSKQLTGSVCWEETMMNSPASMFFEVGAGNQLRAMMRRIDMKKWKATKNI